LKKSHQLIKRLVVEVISASKSYMKKEAVRQAVQDLVASKVASKEIKNQEQLDEWFVATTLAITSLKMVPFEVYKKLVTK